MRMMTLALSAAFAAAIATSAAPQQAHAESGLAMPSATDFSSARKSKAKRANVATPRYRHGPGTIACTRAGCSTVPPGCHAVRERTVDGSPSGFEIIVC